MRGIIPLVVALSQLGCATAGEIAKSCVATSDQTLAINNAFVPDFWQSEIEKAIAQFGLCMVKAVAQDIVNRSLQLATPVGTPLPPKVQHAAQFLAEHP
jgi:hypothetical protein